MKLHRFLLLLLTVVCCGLSGVAKDNQKNANKDAEANFLAEKAKKEASLCVKQLKLKGDSARIFTEIYVNYQKDLHKAFEKNRTSVPNKAFVQKSRNQTDSDIRKRFAMAHDLLNIREKYYSKFLRVVSPEQYEQFSLLEQRLGEMMRHEKRQRDKVNNNSTSKERTNQRQATQTRRATATPEF